MEIVPSKVHQWMKENKPINLLDVRRDDERAFASLGGVHIPLHELEARFIELPQNGQPWIVYCHLGVRSLHATQFLKFHGYDALSLRGGIEEWSTTIDPSVPRY
jgi:rhodanese-related sulfurtransferase